MASSSPARRRVRWWDRQGLRGGLVAGIGAAAVEISLLRMHDGAGAVARLLRRITAMWAGSEVLDPAYPFAQVAVVGAVLHLGLSAVFGLVFTWWSESVAPGLVRSRVALIGAATLYGLLLWPLNAYVVAPLFGWDWFARAADPASLAAAHLAYGVLLGLYLDRRVVRWRARGVWPWGRGDRTPSHAERRGGSS